MVKIIKISTLLSMAFVFGSAAVLQATAAEELTGAQIAAKMENAMLPAASSTRRIDMSIRSPQGDVVEWTGRQAQKIREGRRSVVTVLVGPESVKGFAVLVTETADGPDSSWIYIPPVRRVRRLASFDRLDSFLGTEFTYEDLGLLDVGSREVELVGKRTHDGKPAYELRETFPMSAMFSRVSTLLSADTFLPIRREYYDSAGELWKVASYDPSVVVETIPTLLRIRIEDHQQSGSSELKVSEVSYVTAVKDELFDPSRLPEVAAQMLW
jgi:hypothetical protein